MRRRQASSAFDDVDSRREKIDDVGDANMLLTGEYGPAVEVLVGLGANSGRPRLVPCGDWNGIPPDGTLKRRAGVLLLAYML